MPPTPRARAAPGRGRRARALALTCSCSARSAVAAGRRSAPPTNKPEIYHHPGFVPEEGRKLRVAPALIGPSSRSGGASVRVRSRLGSAVQSLDRSAGASRLVTEREGLHGSVPCGALDPVKLWPVPKSQFRLLSFQYVADIRAPAD